MWVWIIVIAIVGGMAYIRLSPNDPAKWHVDVPEFADKTFAGGAIRVVQGDEADLSRLHDIIVASGATLIAGSLDRGHMTYICRSAVMGFPDFVTVQLKGGQIAIYSRLRFGKSDLGVNARRIDGWVRAMAQNDAGA